METYTFSELLKGYRKRAGFTQQGLAEQAELLVHVQTVKGWENGRVPRYRDTILQISTALSLSHAETDRILMAADYPPEYTSLQGNGYSVNTPPPVPAARTRPEPASPPPKAAANQPSATAPAPPAHFIGRRYHLDTLKQMLTGTSEAPLIALQGMGGIGKTAMAQQLAAEVQKDFPGGVFWGALPDYNGNSRPILRAWGHACAYDFADEGDQTVMADVVRGLLATRSMEQGKLLIIIDDIRNDWLNAAQVLHRAVPRDTSVLLTTRNEALAASLGSTIHQLDTLDSEEAMSLLKKHAGRQIVDKEPETAEKLIAALGYLPLALELSGKHLALKARKPGYKLSRLLQTVTQQANDVLTLPGHPGLVATFSNTYQTLPDHLQRVFRWLSAFAAAPMPITHVATVLDVDEWEAENMLDELVSPALIAWGEIEGTYTIHPLLRQYSKRLLQGATDEIEARNSHLACYLAVAEGNAHETLDSFDNLETALPNVLWALEYAKKHKKYEASNQFCLVLTPFLFARGYMAEAVQLLDDALAACRVTGNKVHESQHLNRIAEVFYIQGDKQKALEKLAAALGLSRQAGETRMEGAQLGNMALIKASLGQLEEALGLVEQALAISRQLGDRRNEGHHLGNLGTMLYSLGRINEAIPLHEEALEISRAIDESHQETNQLRNLGNAYYAKGELEEAVRFYEQSLAVARRMGNHHNMGMMLTILGIAHWDLGHLGDAMEYLGQGAAILEETESPTVERARTQLFELVGQSETVSSDLMLHLIEQIQQITRG
ncbi:MAG: tetratricopeptide repeat protein [Chloroflexota bacterium]